MTYSAFDRMRREARQVRINQLICDLIASGFALAMWAILIWQVIH